MNIFMVDNANHARYAAAKSGADSAGVSFLHVTGGISTLKKELERLV